MAFPVSLRIDYNAALTRAAARRAGDAAQARRLPAIAAVYDNRSRREMARVGSMNRKRMRDWAHRFNDEGPQGLVNRKAPGADCKLSVEQLAELANIVETRPDPQTDGVVRWRCIDLRALIQKFFRDS